METRPCRTTDWSTRPYRPMILSCLNTFRDTTANCRVSESWTARPKFHVKLCTPKNPILNVLFDFKSFFFFYQLHRKNWDLKIFVAKLNSGTSLNFSDDFDSAERNFSREWNNFGEPSKFCSIFQNSISQFRINGKNRKFIIFCSFCCEFRIFCPLFFIIRTRDRAILKILIIDVFFFSNKYKKSGN